MTEIMPLRGFDFHCHVDLFPDPAAAITLLEQNQIFTLAVTTTPKAYPQNQRWTAESLYVYAAVGLHPELVAERQNEIDLLESLVEETPFIGEVGLDGNSQHRSSLPAQKIVFLRVLSTAQRKGGRIVSIHSRRAAREVLRCIQEQTTPDRVLPILHWFSDSLDVANDAVNLGCFFSINPRILKSRQGIKLLRSLPIERILPESDAPFASDEKSDKLLTISDISQMIASVRGEDANMIASFLIENCSRVLKFAGIQ